MSMRTRKAVVVPPQHSNASALQSPILNLLPVLASLPIPNPTPRARAQSDSPSSVPYLAEGIAQLVSHPTSLPNRTFSFVEYSPTGDELAEILTSLHGSQTVLEEYTEEQFEHDVQRGGLDAVVAGLKRLWGQEHKYTNVTQVEGFQSVPLEELLRGSLGTEIVGE